MSQDVVEVAEGVIAEQREFPPALRQMLQVMALESSSVTDEDANTDFLLKLMENILTAETFEDVFTTQTAGMLSGKDHTDKPFWLKESGISIRKSTKDGQLPFYAVLNVVDIETGEELTLNCGGTTFLTVLHKLRMDDYFSAEKGCPEEGRPLVLVAKESPAGAYLLLMPYRIITPATPNGRGKK